MKWLKKVLASILSFSGCSSKKVEKSKNNGCPQLHCTCHGPNVCHSVSHNISTGKNNNS